MCKKGQKKRSQSDPSWNSTFKTKNGKKAARPYTRRLKALIQQKSLADKKKVSATAVCVTRTVELPSTQTAGVEKSKLLFMLSIGLIPKTDVIQKCPSVLLKKLDPILVAEAKAKTKKRIFEICERRNLPVVQQHTQRANIPTALPISSSSRSSSSRQGAQSVSKKGVADYIDLVSSDSDDDDEIVEITETPSVFTETFRSRLHKSLGYDNLFRGPSPSNNYWKMSSLLQRKKPRIVRLLKNSESEIIKKMNSKQIDAGSQSLANGDKYEIASVGDSSSSSGFSELESFSRDEDDEIITID